MLIKFDKSGIRNSKAREYVIRFLFGGVVTVAVGLVAREWGPVIAGLFLAFPAIFSASATLLQSKEEERKHKAGLPAGSRGMEVAGVDAVGAALGSCGLLVFAAFGWKFLSSHPAALVLAAAASLWLTASAAIWFLWKAKIRRI
jgi:hypothetical protein